MKLSEKQKKEILTVARKVIASEFKKNESLEISSSLREVISKIGGIYVTLKKNNKLRGRSGSAEQEILGKSLIEHSKKAAFEDQRFNPVQKDELDEIKIELVIISELEAVSGEDAVEKINIGKTGIILKSGAYSSVILPNEAKEKNWDKKELLEQACIKAGLLPDAWLDVTTTIYLFHGEVISEE